MQHNISRFLRPIRSLFRHYQKGRLIASTLLRYGELAPPRFYIFDDRKLIYLEMPKAGCTSIKTTIGQAYQIEVQDELNIHDHEAWCCVWGRHPKRLSDYTIFTFVRNPYARLVSCYRDKIIDIKQRYSIPYFDVHARYHPYHIPSDISFEEFAKIVIKIPDRLAERHFKSQYAMLSKRGKIQPDFIGRLENVESDWARLAEAYRFNTQLVNEHATMVDQSKKGYINYYTPELVDLVYNRYKQDFEQLGYSAAPSELREELTKSGCSIHNK